MTAWMLGLDIGSDSLGWAAFGCDGTALALYPNTLLEGGVRLFDSGRDAKKQTSLHADRGALRRSRRIPRARRWRKAQLRDLLHAGGIAPPNRDFTDDVYRWRAKAVEHPLDSAELWAVLTHIANHRGFLSNRIEHRDLNRIEHRDMSAAVKAGDSGDDKDSGYWIANERAVRERMAAVSARTVGEFLYGEITAGRPVRMRYGSGGTVPTRALLHEEFAVIRSTQEADFPALDWPAIEDCIFTQRPLRSAEGGVCEFFPDQDRCWRMMPSAQEFLVRQTLCNLRVITGKYREERPLTAEEWSAAHAALSAAPRIDWSALRGAIGLKKCKFTVETAAGGRRAARGTDGNQTEALLAPLVPGWRTLPLDIKDERMTLLIEARRNRRALIRLLADPDGWFRLTDDDAEMVADGIQFVFPTGRLKISAKAALLISERLVAGVPTHEAIAAATGRSHSDRRPTTKLARLPYYGTLMPDAALGGTGKPSDPCEKRFGRLGNVSVHIAMNETAKIVNSLIERHGGPPAMVVIETTRELKLGAEDRLKLIGDQSKRESENKAIDQELAASGAGELVNKREQRLRYRLWTRQKSRCPYTGRIIGGADLLTAAYEVDHIIPLALGGQDIFNNMVLCVAGANRAKANRLPCDAFRDDENTQAAIARFLAELDKGTHALMAWRFGDAARKRLSGQGTEEDDDGWAPRQIRDTSYVARLAMRYLHHVAGDVVASKGALTAWLRAAWDLPKARWDHRSHFIDAAVIAVTNRSLVQAANTLRARGTLPRGCDVDLEEPYPGFRYEILRAWEHLWPSYRPSHQSPNDGALHAETLYRLRPTEVDGAPAEAVMQRRRVADLFKDNATAAKSLDAFGSASMRKRFLDVVESKRLAHSETGLAELCRLAAADPCWGPRGMTGNTVLAQKQPQSLRRIPRGNHHALVATDGNLLYQVWERSGPKPKWEARVITRFDAARSDTAPTPPPPGMRLVMELRQGDLVYVPTVDGDKVFLVKKMATDGRLNVWPARYAISEKDLPFIQERFPGIRLDKKHYWELSSAEALRKNGVRRATVSVLGRLRAK